jgi:hypothetical protein
MPGFGEMTAEVKYYLDVDDILVVRLECSACRVSSSFPLAKLSRVAEEEAISRFLSSLRGAAGALKGRPFKLSLEVNYEEGEAPI